MTSVFFNSVCMLPICYTRLCISARTKLKQSNLPLRQSLFRPPNKISPLLRRKRFGKVDTTSTHDSQLSSSLSPISTVKHYNSKHCIIPGKTKSLTRVADVWQNDVNLFLYWTNYKSIRWLSKSHPSLLKVKTITINKTTSRKE